MKKSYIILSLSSIISVFMIGKAFLLNEDIKMLLLTFFAVGCGLALLRLFINSSIRKMKGKSLVVKLLFFAVLLGFGLPFQAWFRKEVLFSMDSAYLPSCIIITVVAVFFMTTLFGLVMKNRSSNQMQRNKKGIAN